MTCIIFREIFWKVTTECSFVSTSRFSHSSWNEGWLHYKGKLWMRCRGDWDIWFMQISRNIRCRIRLHTWFNNRYSKIKDEQVVDPFIDPPPPIYPIAYPVIPDSVPMLSAWVSKKAKGHSGGIFGGLGIFHCYPLDVTFRKVNKYKRRRYVITSEKCVWGLCRPLPYHLRRRNHVLRGLMDFDDISIHFHFWRIFSVACLSAIIERLANERVLWYGVEFRVFTRTIDKPS